jgi:hypothetical protein
MWTLCFCICLCWYSMIWKEKSLKFCLPSKNTFSLIERWNNFCLIWNRFGNFWPSFYFVVRPVLKGKKNSQMWTDRPRLHLPPTPITQTRPDRTFVKVQKNAPMTKDDVEFSVDRLSKNQEKPKWINTV